MFTKSHYEVYCWKQVTIAKASQRTEDANSRITSNCLCRNSHIVFRLLPLSVCNNIPFPMLTYVFVWCTKKVIFKITWISYGNRVSFLSWNCTFEYYNHWMKHLKWQQSDMCFSTWIWKETAEFFIWFIYIACSWILSKVIFRHSRAEIMTAKRRIILEVF